MGGDRPNRLICGCMRVYEGQIRQAVREGARTFYEIQDATLAGSSCGNCRILIERILREELAKTDEAGGQDV